MRTRAASPTACWPTSRAWRRAEGRSGRQAETLHGLGQLLRLQLQAFGRRSGLLHQRGILLSYLIELGDRGVDLADALALLGRRARDFRDDGRHALGRVDDLA